MFAEEFRDARGFGWASASAPPHDWKALMAKKAAEIERDPDVLVVFQSSGAYASIVGTARISRDRAKIDSLWQESWRLWFPEGTDDPRLCLLTVTAREGEYWDNKGLQALGFMTEAVKALFKGKQPTVDEGRNAKVKL